MHNVLITDGNSVAALAVARSLGRKGINVTVAEDSKAISFYSKYAKNSFVYPSPHRNKKGFLDFIVKEVRENRYDVLMPVTDNTMIPLMEKFDVLSKYTYIPMSDYKTIDKTLDKSETLRIAERIGIPIPKTYFINDLEDVKIMSKEIDYPCVIKPRRSRFYSGNQMISTYRVFANSPQELIERYNIQHEKLSFPLIQELVSGRGVGIFLLFNKGKMRAIFSHKRLREVPASGGVSTLCESIRPDPALKEHAVRILEVLKWHGVAMVEFKTDDRDKVPKLMEINGRFWGSLPLAVCAGVDFPYLLYKMATEGDIESVEDYKLGIKCRWLKGDAMRLLEILFRIEQRQGRKSGLVYPSKWSSIREFMKFREKDICYYNESAVDPLPSMIEFKNFFCFLIKNASRGF